MNLTRRQALRLLGPAAIAIAATATLPARAQMERTGTVEIQNDRERAAFAALTCSCGGCPHESLSTCTCGFAHRARLEIRGMLEQGMTLEQIKADFVQRYGTVALAVPPNSGANRLLYLGPLAAIAAGAAFLVALLRRLKQRGEAPAAAGEAAAAATATNARTSSGRDDYDDKLDDELKQLD